MYINTIRIIKLTLGAALVVSVMTSPGSAQRITSSNHITSLGDQMCVVVQRWGCGITNFHSFSLHQIGDIVLFYVIVSWFVLLYNNHFVSCFEAEQNLLCIIIIIMNSHGLLNSGQKCSETNVQIQSFRAR